MKYYLHVIFIFFISSSCLASYISANSPSDWGKYAIVGNKFIISGNITRLTLAGLHSVKDKIHDVEINSKGGDLDVAEVMAKIISHYKMDTYVAHQGKCMSAAVLVFLAGKKRVAHPGAEFMIHKVSVNSTLMNNENFSDPNAEAQALKLMSEQYISYGVEHKVIAELLESSDDIKFTGVTAKLYGFASDVDPKLNSLTQNLVFDWKRPEIDFVDEISTQYGLDPIIVSPMTGTTN